MVANAAFLRARRAGQYRSERSSIGRALPVIAVLLGLVACVTDFGSAVGSAATLPQIGVTTLQLVDESRADPWQPTARRELSVTIDYPAAAGAYPAADDLLPGLSGTLRSVRVYANPPVAAGTKSLPVLLYSPGAGLPARAGASVAEALAASGYAVVSIGDTHGSVPGTVFPDGHIALYDPRNVTEPARAHRISWAARTGDIRFVLDELTLLTHGSVRDSGGRALPSGLGAAMDLTRVGMFGHSLGGTSSVYADPRVRAGVDLDGYSDPAQLGTGLVADSRRPILFMADGRADQVTRRRRMGLMCAGRVGWTRAVVLADSGHLSFTDLEYLPPSVTRAPAVSSLFGTIAPDRAHAAITAYVKAMFDHILGGRPEPLLDGPSAAFPEITFDPHT
ncbi:hypothetical protein KO481_05940 [Nocardia sp. NEAU-G5]|uniref:Lipase n=2 Tax=Nocardia albiluteola TaxID=2842303 RepID=A0ABS6AUY5_9NOCA|nr:hypothetical protein [Nocardia albiluteola]